jgi:hypothetical protein
MANKHRFEWGYVTHPGVWACGGGRQDIPPVLIGITFQVPQKEPEYAWWCYLGPRPEFENEFDPEDKDRRYFDQCDAVPQRITKNMANRFVQPDELLQIGELGSERSRTSKD